MTGAPQRVSGQRLSKNRVIPSQCDMAEGLSFPDYETPLFRKKQGSRSIINYCSRYQVCLTYSSSSLLGPVAMEISLNS